MKLNLNKKNGFSYVEILVGVAIFAMIFLSVFQVYNILMGLVSTGKVKVVAAALIEEQFEIIRNIPYSDVGTTTGIPVGKIEASKVEVRSGIPFTVITTIRNIDDPFDGTLGGNPNDLSPADYKLVEVSASCNTCNNFKPVVLNTRVSPKNLEGASTNGALFVRVFDANGLPVVGANVHIENNNEMPAIIIDDVTDNNGNLKIIDAPPGVEVYEITVTKNGYSTDKTYATGELSNPNPIKAHASVFQQQVTQISFAVDTLATLNISSVTDTCASVPNVDFDLKGSKLIGTGPDVLKYEQSLFTGAGASVSLSDLEWDVYDAFSTDANYDFAGYIPLLPLNLSPGSTQNLQLVVSTKSTNSFLVTVKDFGTQLPLKDTEVILSKGGEDTTLITNLGFQKQTDWSLGAGQTDFINEKKFFNSDGDVTIDNPAGEVVLRDSFGTYASSGELESSSFDMGAGSNFDKISWVPQGQPPQTGPNSVKFQLASNNDNLTWNFVGPDGTANTFYTISDSDINTMHDGDRYFRYKLFLQTINTNFTPNLSEVSFTFTSGCVPPGQVLFKNMESGTYSLTASSTGYAIFNDANIDISSPWSTYEVLLSP